MYNSTGCILVRSFLLESYDMGAETMRRTCSSVFQNRLNPKTGQYTRDPGKASKGSSSEPSGVCLGLGYAAGVISGSVSHQIQEIITQLNLMWCIAMANLNVNKYSPAGAARMMVALPILPDPFFFNYGGARDLMWRLQRGGPLRQVAVLGDEDDNEDEDEELVDEGRRRRAGVERHPGGAPG